MTQEPKLELWCMSLGFPTSRPFEDNGGEFSNVKLDELTSKQEITVKFGLAYSPWNNGINERNTSVNKLGYSPLKLVTGKSVCLP